MMFRKEKHPQIAEPVSHLTVCELENTLIEIVDLPIQNGDLPLSTWLYLGL